MQVVRIFASAVVRKIAYVLTGAALAFLATQCHAAQCVVVGPGDALIIDPAAPPLCTGYVLMTAAEFAAYQPFPGALSVDDGTVIGTAIFAAWALAFGLRMIRRIIEDASLSERS